MSRSELDPGACRVRHISRGVSTELGAVEVLADRYFVPEPDSGVNGRQGWQSAQIELRMSDDGSFTVRFPNAAGEDGKLHRRRFAVRTDPLYRPGEEWLEFYREPNDLLLVGTPVRSRLDRSELVLEGQDGMVLPASSRATEADIWVGAAPREVLEHYLGAQVQRVAVDLRGWTGTNDPRTADWTFAGAPAPAVAGDGIVLDDPAGGAGGTQSMTLDLPAGLTNRDFVLEVRFRHTLNASANGRLRTSIANLVLAPQHGTGSAAAGLLVGNNLALNPARYQLPGIAVHRIIARGEWVYFYLNGELLGHARRDPAVELDRVLIDTVDATGVVQSVRLLTHEPLLGVEGCEQLLPGIPPPGGLRARYYREQQARMTTPDNVWRHATLSPLAEPYAERLEAPNVGPAGGQNPPAWQPPGPPNGEAFSVRWTGAINLDLEASDRTLSFSMGGDNLGRGRVWIAGKLVLDFSGVAGSPQIADRPLRALLGEAAGWYPILVEYSHLTGSGGLILFDNAGAALNVGTRQPIPTSRLSPIGTVDHEARHQSYREVFDELASGFGYQWTVEPRSLESGMFPGQVCPRVRLGYDTDLVITDIGRPADNSEEAAEVVSEVDASDCADALIVDASGLASLEDGAQLTHEAFLPAVDHLIYSQAYESLAEISEEPLLRTRTESLLALRSSPNEIVGVRPQGKRDLVDRFPLPDTPDLRRMLWTPGLGVRLALEDVDVVDRTPRQLTVITWPLVPDGAAPPIVGFRQRPRGLRAVLERTRRAALAPQRHYQGQHITYAGTHGIKPTAAATPDEYSRLALPLDLERVSQLLFHVTFNTATTAQAIEVNGVVTGLNVPAGTPGPIDVTRFLGVQSLTRRDVFARISTAPVGGGLGYQLIAIVRI